MTERKAFELAILANPGDMTPRLVFADWLDEQGTPEDSRLAAFIRGPVIERHRYTKGVKRGQWQWLHDGNGAGLAVDRGVPKRFEDLVRGAAGPQRTKLLGYY